MLLLIIPIEWFGRLELILLFSNGIKSLDYHLSLLESLYLLQCASILCNDILARLVEF